MKTLFMLALVSSITYLAWQESPRIAGWVDSAKTQMPLVVDTVGDQADSIKDDVLSRVEDPRADQIEQLVRDLETLQAKQRELYALVLAKDEIDSPSVIKNERDDGASVAHKPTVRPIKKEEPNDFVSDESDWSAEPDDGSSIARREALISLAERMELRALDLVFD